MSAVPSDAKVQLRNAESSVLFLQQEHGKTLEGLYSEISKLQKKCGELTFQMAMTSTSLTPDEENDREKCIRAEKELKKKKDELVELGKLLETKSRHNSLLERNLRTSEVSLEETVRTKDKKIVSLSAELRAKADTIAHLTKQLHDSKVACAELNDRLSTNELILDREPSSPAPPGERPPASGRRRFVRKVPSSNGAVDVTETLKNGANPSSQKILFNIKTAKSSDGFPARSVRGKTPTLKSGRHAKSMPSGDDRSLSGHSRVVPDDYTEFLKTGSKPEPKLVYKPVPNPLPPILNENGGATKGSSYKVHRSRGQDTGMVDEILVSPLNSPDKSWRHGSSHYDPVS